MNNYTEKDIKTLQGLEHIRHRPALYIADTEASGILQLFKEVVGNSIDEIIQPEAKQELHVTVLKNKITVTDFGRGIPITKVTEVSAVVNTGGKFEKNKAYSGAQTGLHGVGLKAVNALSSYFKITSRRPEGEITCIYSRGKLLSKTTNNRKSKNRQTGVVVEFIPDFKIFDTTSNLSSKIHSLCEQYAQLIPGLKLKLTINNEVTILKFNKGLEDKLKLLLQKEQQYYTPIIIEAENFQLLFTHINRETEQIISYANYVSTTEGGVHVTEFKTALTLGINELLQTNYNGSDIRNGLLAIVNVLDTDPKFGGHTKSKLVGSSTTFVGQFKERIMQALNDNSSALKYIAKQAAQLQQEREQSKQLKATTKTVVGSLSFLSTKLSKCLTRDISKRELFIVEGESAGGTVKKARDPYYQAVYALKGKPLNTASIHKYKALENEELYGLAHTLGILEDIDNLQYDKIILLTDADYDGYHIQNLLLTFLGKYFSPLLQQEKVFILHTPLYKITTPRKVYYLYSEEEKNKRLEKHNNIIEITRHKGLGEMSVNDMRVVLQTKENNMICVNLNETFEEDIAFYCGNNTPERTQLIFSTIQ